jgi:serine protease Do
MGATGRNEGWREPALTVGAYNQIAAGSLRLTRSPKTPMYLEAAGRNGVVTRALPSSAIAFDRNLLHNSDTLPEMNSSDGIGGPAEPMPPPLYEESMRPVRRPTRARLLAAILAIFVAAAPLWAADPKPLNEGLHAPKVFDKDAPTSVDDLRTIEKHVHQLIEKVTPCVVGIRSKGGEGSGVIVSADGKVLTAGHVSGKPGRELTVILPSGKQLKAKSLGHNADIDSGMAQILDQGPWPFAEMGTSADLPKGQWCLTLGHPGGYKANRTPVARLGRILESKKDLIRTDCALVGGDSGGPLFDMDGKVIGIHSRIGPSLTENVHVPIDTYRETWDRLTSSESWGGSAGRRGAWLGVEDGSEGDECRIGVVMENSPAQKAGLKAGDVVTRVDDQRIRSFQDLMECIQNKQPNDEINVEVRRGDGTVTAKVKLERAPRS